MLDNSYLRSQARLQLGGNIFCERWLLVMAVCAIWALVNTVFNFILPDGLWTYTYLNALGEKTTIDFSAILFDPIISIATGMFLFGVIKISLQSVRGQYLQFSSVFAGFKEDFTGNFLLVLLQYIYTFLWSLLFLIPGIVKSYSYALAPYIKQDDMGRNRGANAYITKSREMMDGYKGQLFLLDLSFIGWYLVGALCLGVGVFFVYPYHQVARANFYEELKKIYLASKGI